MLTLTLQVDVIDNRDLIDYEPRYCQNDVLFLKYALLRACSPLRMTYSRTERSTMPNGVVSSIEEFEKNFSCFTTNSLQYVDFNNVLVAGGSVLAAMMTGPGLGSMSVRNKGNTKDKRATTRQALALSPWHFTISSAHVASR